MVSFPKAWWLLARTSFHSWLLSAELEGPNSLERILPGLLSVLKLIFYAADILLTISALKNTVTAHGTPPYIVWAAVVTILAIGGWLMDVFWRSTHRLRWRQLCHRIIKLAIAI
jgi:hypothetical protein